MNNLLLHPTTKHQIDSYVSAIPQSLIIVGKQGNGKKTIAKYISQKVLSTDNLDKHPYFLQISPENNVITIDKIRHIHKFVSNTTIGTESIRRIINIYDAQYMNAESQNSLLKILEEPPTDTMIILSSSDLTTLKPTIKSRTQILLSHPVTFENAYDYFKNNHSTEDVNKAYYLSNGEPGLMYSLLSKNIDHPLVSNIMDAKNILKSTKFERLINVDEYSKDKIRLEQLLIGLQKIAEGGMKSSLEKNDPKLTKKFFEISNLLLISTQQFKNNVNNKLLLTNLFLSL